MSHHRPVYHSFFLYFYIFIVKYTFRRSSAGTGVLATWKAETRGPLDPRLADWSGNRHTVSETNNTHTDGFLRKNTGQILPLCERTGRLLQLGTELQQLCSIVPLRPSTRISEEWNALTHLAAIPVLRKLSEGKFVGVHKFKNSLGIQAQSQKQQVYHHKPNFIPT